MRDQILIHAIRITAGTRGLMGGEQERELASNDEEEKEFRKRVERKRKVGMEAGASV